MHVAWRNTKFVMAMLQRPLKPNKNNTFNEKNGSFEVRALPVAGHLYRELLRKSHDCPEVHQDHRSATGDAEIGGHKKNKKRKTAGRCECSMDVFGLGAVVRRIGVSGWGCQGWEGTSSTSWPAKTGALPENQPFFPHFKKGGTKMTWT